MKTPRAIFIIATALVALVLSACSGAGFNPVGQNLDGGQPGDATGRDYVDPAAPAPDEAGGFTGEEPAAGQTDRSIIKTGEITVEVDNVPETTGLVRALAVELGGFISSSFQGEFEDSATLTMRIPADQFDAAIAAIHDLDGEIKAEASRQEDVTAVVIDMEARLENLRAAETEYRELLDRAETVEDILAIQNQLFAVRGEIEAMQAQLEYYTDQVELATLTVSIIPVPAPVEQATEDFDPAAIVQEALASLVSFGQWLVSAGIWFLIVGLPILLVLGIVLFIGFRIVRRVSSNRSAASTPGSEPPATT